eukprot:SAG11_NODE_9583_length_898_cov_2.117647_1_plen_23_part_01
MGTGTYSVESWGGLFWRRGYFGV